MKNNSPYSAAVTGCGFMIDEFNKILPILMSDNAEDLLKKEVVENELLLIRSESSRQRAVFELRKRYNTLPRSFWEHYLEMDHSEQVIAIFYDLLKTYRIFFDFQVNLVLKHWNSVDQTITKNDLVIYINEIAANDAFVDTWTEQTRGRVASAFLTTLRKVGMLGQNINTLIPIQQFDSSLAYYISIGETWFLEACLLQPYEIDHIKQIAL